jgi:hypothetical protein
MGVVLSMGELRGLVSLRVTSRKTRPSGGGERTVDLAAEAAGEVGERAGALPLEAGVDRGAALRSVPGVPPLPFVGSSEGQVPRLERT